MTATPHILINGTVYHIIGEAPNTPRVAQATGRSTVLAVRRPNGVKTYAAERLPDSEVYGANRGRILCSL